MLIDTLRYKNDLLEEQKTELKAVIKLHHHDYFSPEILRELQNSKTRGADATAGKKHPSILLIVGRFRDEYGLGLRP